MLLIAYSKNKKGGEYLSLNKIEAVVKLMPLVDNCCVVAHPSKDYCMCLITPNAKKIQENLEKANNKNKGGKPNGFRSASSKTESDHLQEMVNEFVRLMDDDDDGPRRAFEKELFEHCVRQGGLERFEVPTRVKFVHETWLPDSGLVTDSLKLKRREIEKFYENDIKRVYV